MLIITSKYTYTALTRRYDLVRVQNVSYILFARITRSMLSVNLCILTLNKSQLLGCKYYNGLRANRIKNI